MLRINTRILLLGILGLFLGKSTISLANEEPLLNFQHIRREFDTAFYAVDFERCRELAPQVKQSLQSLAAEKSPFSAQFTKIQQALLTEKFDEITIWQAVLDSEQGAVVAPVLKKIFTLRFRLKQLERSTVIDSPQLGLIERLTLNQADLERERRELVSEITTLKKRISELELERGLAKLQKDYLQRINLLELERLELADGLARVKDALEQVKERERLVLEKETQLDRQLAVRDEWAARFATLKKDLESLDEVREQAARDRNRYEAELSELQKQLQNISGERREALLKVLAEIALKTEKPAAAEADSKVTDATEEIVEVTEDRLVPELSWKIRYDALKAQYDRLTKPAEANEQMPIASEGATNQHPVILKTTVLMEDQLSQQAEEIEQLKAKLAKSEALANTYQKKNDQLLSENRTLLMQWQAEVVAHQAMNREYWARSAQIAAFKRELEQLAREHFFSYGVFGVKLENLVAKLFPSLVADLSVELDEGDKRDEKGK